MTLCSNSEIRRCRPLLGTFVEITARGKDEDRLQAVVAAAFGEIERLQRLLSAHDPASEVSRLNRESVSGPVVVSRETFGILRRADRLAAESGGAFDYTIAPTLANWGLLPRSLRRKDPGNWRDVLLVRHRQVCFLRPLAIDLGGIAKGFAVDRAIAILRASCASAAVVNAGGDLRVFGARPSTVHLRNPFRPQSFAHTIQLQQSALATSSAYFTRRDWRGQTVSHLVNPETGGAITGDMSATVCARECWLADALTKVVLNSPARAKSLLAKYEAKAFMLSA